MNQLQIDHIHFSEPDIIVVNLNDREIYTGPANIGFLDLLPRHGKNILTVLMQKKQIGNFEYDAQSQKVVKDSQVKIKELIIESRYFRSLLTKCGLVEIDLEKNLNFPSKYIDHENVLTMEGSLYLLKFDFPIKHWMQIHKHSRILTNSNTVNQKVKNQIQL